VTRVRLYNAVTHLLLVVLFLTIPSFCCCMRLQRPTIEMSAIMCLVAMAPSIAKNLRGVSITQPVAPRSLAANAAVPISLQNVGLPSIAIPDQQFEASGFDVTIFGIQCSDVSVGNMEMFVHNVHNLSNNTAKPSGSTLKLKINATNAYLKCNTKYKYRLGFFPYVPRGSGDFSVVAAGATQVSGDVLVRGLSLVPGTTDPTLELIDGNCTGVVDVLEEEMEFTNGITSAILRQYKSSLARTVEELTGAGLCEALAQEIPNIAPDLYLPQLRLASLAANSPQN